MAAGSAGEGAGSNTEAPLETFSRLACPSEMELAWVVRAPRNADKNVISLYLMLEKAPCYVGVVATRDLRGNAVWRVSLPAVVRRAFLLGASE